MLFLIGGLYRNCADLQPVMHLLRHVDAQAQRDLSASCMETVSRVSENLVVIGARLRRLTEEHVTSPKEEADARARKRRRAALSSTIMDEMRRK